MPSLHASVTFAELFFLVTGATGVSKTSIRKLIETEPAEDVAVCELATSGLGTMRWHV